MTALLCVAFAFAEQPESTRDSLPSDTPVVKTASTSLKVTRDNVLSIVSIVLPHNSLKNSETLHDWPFFAFAAPSWAYRFGLQQDMGKLASLKGLAMGDASFAGLGLKFDAAVELIHLLELGVGLNTGTALNYGKTATFMGVYDPEKRNYRRDIVFTDYVYGVRYHSTLSIPMLAFFAQERLDQNYFEGVCGADVFRLHRG